MKQNDARVQLVDIRDHDEVGEGCIAEAQHIPRSHFELEIESVIPQRDTPVILYCAGGIRSLFVAETLERLGYTNVYSMADGFNGWKTAGLPWHKPAVLQPDERMRYRRHISIPEVGEEGQLALKNSRVLLVGAGGLGCPAALYLAAAGVGQLGIVDFDVVDESNLQRQILHTVARVGHPKTASAVAALNALNPATNVVPIETRLTRDNIEEIFEPYQIVVDGTDNFPTRYLINDACSKLRIPNVHGSVFRFEGQVTVFKNPDGPCYRCLYPEPPPPEHAPSCAEAGVLGVLPGVVGLLQAVETIKLLLNIGEPLIGQLLHYDALEGEFRKLKIKPAPSCSYCGEGKEFPGYVDYQQVCGQADRK
jgi:molybdopterin/thiamine biosynthesis adenylyltransferase/rhodanese-related sulfurtransferase